MTPMETFAGMEAFARVVETGSFTAAAERLQTAKSSVSETIRALEERLGVRLLDRTTRRVRPTEAGRAFYARCRRLLDEAEAARAEAQASQGATAGRLRVAAPDAFARRYIVPCLPRFFTAYPAIEIELVESASVSRLVDEGLDLAIRVAEKPEPGLVVRRIASSHVVIVATPGYLAALGTPKHPDELPAHRCVGFTPLEWRETWRLGKHKIAIRPKLLTNSGESLRAAALAGIGLVAMPDWSVNEDITAGRLARVLENFPSPTSGIFAVYPTNRLLTPKIRAFVDHLARDLKARGLAP